MSRPAVLVPEQAFDCSHLQQIHVKTGEHNKDEDVAHVYQLLEDHFNREMDSKGLEYSSGSAEAYGWNERTCGYTVYATPPQHASLGRSRNLVASALVKAPVWGHAIVVRDSGAYCEDVWEKAKLSRNECGWCGAANRTCKCPGCKTRYYCDRQCQKHEWKAHKRVCGKIASLSKGSPHALWRFLCSASLGGRRPRFYPSGVVLLL